MELCTHTYTNTPEIYVYRGCQSKQYYYIVFNSLNFPLRKSQRVCFCCSKHVLYREMDGDQTEKSSETRLKNVKKKNDLNENIHVFVQWMGESEHRKGGGANLRCLGLCCIVHRLGLGSS